MKLDLAKNDILKIQDALLANRKAATKAEDKSMDDHGFGSPEYLAAEAKTETAIRLKEAFDFAITDSRGFFGEPR